MGSPILPAQPQSPSSQFYDFPVFPSLGQFEVRTPDAVNDFAVVEAHHPYPPFEGYDENAATTYTSWLDEHMQDCVYALPQTDATTAVELLDTGTEPLAQVGNDQHGATAPPAVSHDAATATIGVQLTSPSNDEHNSRAESNEGKADVSADKNRSRRAKLPQKTLDRFKLQFDIDPYPTTQEVEQLAVEENLESKTVRNWFNNVRARKKPKKPVPELTTEALDAMSITSKNSDESQTSINRYLSTAIEDEGASPEAIKAALEVIPEISSSPLSPKPSLEILVARQRSGSSPASLYSQPHSAGSYGNSAGSASSYRMSAGSSMHSYGSRARRRGRRRHNYRASPYHSRPSSVAEGGRATKSILSFISSDSTPDLFGFDKEDSTQDQGPRYTCTFCGKDLKTRHEWKRHEAIHLPSKVWICCRVGVPPSSKSCKFDECAAKAEAERTFHRKDHLSQHIRNCHGSRILGAPSTFPSEWEYQPPLEDTNKLVCGFCGRKCDDWNDRIDHVGDHFADGSNYHRDWMHFSSSSSSAMARTATKIASKISKVFTCPKGAKERLDPLPPKPKPFRETLAKYDTTRQDLLRAVVSEQREDSPTPPTTLKGEVQCCYCYQTFASHKQASKQHSDCPSWSCLWFPGADLAFVPSERASRKTCAYCGKIFPDGRGHRLDRRDHVHNSHVKQCEGNVYTDLEAFVGHLALEHNYRAQTLATEKALTPFLMKRPSVFESCVDGT